MSRPVGNRPRRAAYALISVGVASAFAITSLPAAYATPSATAVISEVYGGGGNSGATLTRDFVELGNAGSAAYDLVEATACSTCRVLRRRPLCGR